MKYKYIPIGNNIMSRYWVLDIGLDILPMEVCETSINYAYGSILCILFIICIIRVKQLIIPRYTNCHGPLSMNIDL